MAKVNFKRIHVAVTSDTVTALELLIEREGVGLTEALRRLVGYGDFIYRATKERGATLLLKDDDSIREIIIL